ncbi:hypothetical protein [Duganella qianjiadongensis]|uniref:Phospholipase n=1 Tax=Duganella qianjiadongensis TaxID=2692176 RepID=A0ABW9VNX0_9BURK|nr:hypothetical protein [Duganella qianjiadongensis]MYM41165.1 hypothetical protein [Duganella qianjiadongensis]
MSGIAKLVAAASLAAASVNLAAFEINPKHDPEKLKLTLKSEYQHFLAHLTHPTHEELTQLSFQCAATGSIAAWCNLSPMSPEAAASAQKFDEQTLILGARWNDDPNNFFNANQEATWLFWLKAAAHTNHITDHYPLEYRSHFGDLQFLHGMGSNGDSASITQQRIVDWAHFAYDVATQKISPDASLASLHDKYSFVSSLTGTSKRDWSVRKLFTNVNDVLWPHYEDVSADTAQVAALSLGALLHTVQDSFSHSHADRIWDRNDGHFPVKAWLDYRAQKASCHGAADKEFAFITDTVSPKPAMVWGAWIVRQAMLGEPWAGEMEKAFKTQLFEIEGSGRNSDAGGYDKCPAPVVSTLTSEAE